MKTVFGINTAAHLRPASEPVASAGIRKDRQRLSDLISVVYDAAVDQSLWENAIERAASFVGGVGAGLFCKDVDAQHVSAPHRFGIVWPLPVALFRQIYPAAVGHFLAEIEQPIATADLMPYDELTATGFYREWARPQGLIDFVSAVLDRSATSVAMFGVFRHERDGFVDTLDGLDAGLCLVDERGRIIHANAAGQAILDARDILYDLGGRLAACDAQVNQTLRDVFAAAGQGDAALGTKGIAVPLI